MSRPALPPLLIASLAMLTAFAPMSIDMYLPAFPTIRAEFASSASQVQLSLSAFMLAFGFGQIVYGPLGDYFGRRPVLIAGIVLYIAVSVLCLLAQSAPQLILLRFIQGLAACAPPVMARTMVRDLAERDQAAQVMSILMASSSMAPMLAPLIGSQVMFFFGWRAIFTTLAIFGALSLGMALLVTRETLRPEHRGPLAFGGIIARFAELLRSGVFMGYALTTGFLFGAMFSFISLSSFVLIGIYGLAPATYSFVFGATVAHMLGYTDPVSMATIGAGAITYIVGPVTGAALGATSAVIALSIATGVLKAVLVMIGTPFLARFVGLDNPRSAMAFGGLMGTVSGVTGGLAATDPKLVPYGALTATFHTGIGCLLAPSVLFFALKALMGG